MINKIRMLAGIELVLGASYIVSAFMLESSLPPLLQEYLAQQMETDISSTEIFTLFVGLIVIAFHLISLIGLLFVKVWARKIFLITTLFMFPLCLFIGPSIDHSISYTIDQVSVLVQGMLLALLLYNTTYQEFSLKKQINDL